MNKKIKLGLAMLELKGFGRARVRPIIESMSQIPTTATEAMDALSSFIIQTGKKLPEVTLTDMEVAMDNGARIADSCGEIGINIDFIDMNDDRQWIQRFVNIPNPPLLLFSSGDTSVMDMPTIAIIGTRNPTYIGKSMAESTARKSVESGFCVVSGLAMGCDVHAHSSTLENNGNTVAVLAHGLDEIHPTQHKEIAKQIIAQGGCLLSEYAPGSPIERGNFVDRDRLQSAASLGLLVIETSLTGGSMHTVSFAEKQKRPIACLDHPIKYHDMESVKGNRHLISQDAIAIWDESSMDNFLNTIKKDSKMIDKKEPKQESLI